MQLLVITYHTLRHGFTRTVTAVLDFFDTAPQLVSPRVRALLAQGKAAQLVQAIDNERHKLHSHEGRSADGTVHVVRMPALRAATHAPR